MGHLAKIRLAAVCISALAIGAGCGAVAPLSSGAQLPLLRSSTKALVIGGFNETRGGQQSLQDPAVAGLRSAITQAFPTASFKFAGKLTSTFLGHVTVVMLGVGKSATSGIKPLSKSEQTALAAFVRGGGAALIFTDNSTFDSNAKSQNKSLLAPFGLAAAGTLDGNQAAPFTGSKDPIANGPFGTASQLDTFFPGWFSKTGSSKVLASFSYNGKPAVAYLPARGSSGAVVLFADSSLLFDSNRTANDQTAILNAFALAP